ncbi:formylglycine-generating enzyme family protein [Enterobacter hormaechei]|uniref:formylglycine-generating enzyme family protein n=1 Tax=Enterobacter hormaechei TaxID=158836 RepID=UPI001F4DDB0A|nr:formylglycine-generating enzyme family protein [Enterobacter hormaechei]MCH9327444.1 formylglycine-generating enzyme family protein [Enterobacter hormaechei]MCH9423853.1 formylglycine-generating enzyme family protein [Enterobacter hormaechei]MCU2456711.1 formylglycine-generating enzyme family protein [Enterobacter hormaechei subsp. hoffmannii]MCW4747119.1 formylglycine-generating enzyme family protein [Enterobacter hormaechei subsp. hoffmannii]
MKKLVKIGLMMLTVAPLMSCDQQNSSVMPAKKNSNDLSKFVDEIKSEQIFVEGGEFLMGDYGEQYGPEHLPYDANQHSKPLHKVELTSYSISKFKTSNKQYQFYLTYNNQYRRTVSKENPNLKKWDKLNMTPQTPAHVDWNEAQQYCQWLSLITNLPFSLPTEAQWEFAARSRGQFIIVPTEDGTIQIKNREGVNITTSDDREKFAQEQGSGLGILSPMPRDARPPNPLGIYDMAGNGWEWMKDWYDPDYYKHSPLKDPQGPDNPVYKDYNGNYTKVVRSQDFSGPRRGLTITRYFSDPKNRGHLPSDKTVRCVVNSPKPVR